MTLLGRLKCRIGLHKGHIECYNGWAFLHCSRCDRLTSPASPRVTQRLYDEEGYGELGPLEREKRE
ncbi:hypothetical protein [Halomontanus rarus]|uniref:hypothetical protein n=1 Tax=Halomontanus rarus TaxID=3034020 RepID=UPI0023E79608|nr:hypothetical protein [Halovivax sp. TS33]